MATISLCMIVKNEEAVLERCLRSASPVVDEIIVVDTGSDDTTKEIARQFTEKVYDFPWIDDFSAARNFSFSKAEMDYCFWLDADDVLELEDQSALLELKGTLDCDVVMMRYQVGSLSFYRERLLRRSCGFLWEGAVHEAITPRGSVMYSEITVHHRKEQCADPSRNLRIYEKQVAKGIRLNLRDRLYYARELTYHQRDREAIPLLEGVLQEEGWVETLLEACRLLSGCYLRIGEERKAFASLLYGFSLDLPRAEFCCDLGDLFLGQKNYATAVYWYHRALDRVPPERNGGFIQRDRYGIYPALQLCVCYDRMGNRKEAIFWNERAADFEPEHPSVKRNRDYFMQ